jgi:hypothetical protein
VQKLHDFLAHSSEESEETCSSPRLVMNQSTGNLKLTVPYVVLFYLFLFIYFKDFFLFVFVLCVRLLEFVCTICMLLSKRPEDWISLEHTSRFPGTGVRGGCEPL